MAVGGRKSIFSMLTYKIRFVFGCNNRTVPKYISVILSEGLLQAVANEHFAGDNDQGNHILIDYYGGCHGNKCLAILTNNEECHFRAVQRVWVKLFLLL